MSGDRGILFLASGLNDGVDRSPLKSIAQAASTLMTSLRFRDSPTDRVNDHRMLTIVHSSAVPFSSQHAASQTGRDDRSKEHQTGQEGSKEGFCY